MWSADDFFFFYDFHLFPDKIHTETEITKKKKNLCNYENLQRSLCNKYNSSLLNAYLTIKSEQ